MIHAKGILIGSILFLFMLHVAGVVPSFWWSPESMVRHQYPEESVWFDSFLQRTGECKPCDLLRFVDGEENLTRAAMICLYADLKGCPEARYRMAKKFLTFHVLELVAFADSRFPRSKELDGETYFEPAIHALKDLANQGEPRAYVDLAFLLRDRKPEEAHAWFEKAMATDHFYARALEREAELHGWFGLARNPTGNRSSGKAFGPFLPHFGLDLYADKARRVLRRFGYRIQQDDRLRRYTITGIPDKTPS